MSHKECSNAKSTMARSSKCMVHCSSTSPSPQPQQPLHLVHNHWMNVYADRGTLDQGHLRSNCGKFMLELLQARAVSGWWTRMRITTRRREVSRHCWTSRHLKATHRPSTVPIKELLQMFLYFNCTSCMYPQYCYQITIYKASGSQKLGSNFGDKLITDCCQLFILPRLKDHCQHCCHNANMPKLTFWSTCLSSEETIISAFLSWAVSRATSTPLDRINSSIRLLALRR